MHEGVNDDFVPTGVNYLCEQNTVINTKVVLVTNVREQLILPIVIECASTLSLLMEPSATSTVRVFHSFLNYSNKYQVEIIFVKQLSSPLKPATAHPSNHSSTLG